MDDVVEPKIAVTPKEAPPVCMLMADGAIQVLQDHVPLNELQRLLLGAAATLTDRTVQRGALMERVLATIQARYSGFDEDIERALAAALNGSTPAR